MSLGYSDDRSRRTTFDRVAESYGRVEVPFPGGVFDALVELTRLPSRGRVLEIGCGTGRATQWFAEHGYDVTAVELGPALADVARRNLAAYPNVTVHTAAFEEWTLPRERFDVVAAFHAWHWLDRDVALDKARHAGDAIAIVGGQHVVGGDTDFFDE